MDIFNKKRIIELEKETTALRTRLDQIESIAEINLATVKMLDELNWKSLATFRLLVCAGALGADDLIHVIQIEDEATFRQWVAHHSEGLPAGTQKFFNDLAKFQTKGEGG